MKKNFHVPIMGIFLRPSLKELFRAPQPLELSFGMAEIGSMFLAFLIGALVFRRWPFQLVQGIQLTVYIIIAMMFSLIPEITP